MATVALCVAVVDDEVPVRTALGRLLRLSDYDVISFPCGEAFLAALDVRRPDCMILDIHMPGLSGFDVQSRLKASHIDIPVIFITASDEFDLGRKSHEAGGTRLLRKPFSNDELLAAISAALGDRPRGT